MTRGKETASDPTSRLDDVRSRVTALAVIEPEDHGLAVVPSDADRVQARLDALDGAAEPDPLPEAVRNRIMALREDLRPDLRPDHLRADDGGDDVKVFDVDEDVTDSEGLKKATGNGSGSSA